MCLFAMLAGLFPRIALAVVWLARPAMVDAAFDTLIFPLLGLVFVPFTTLMYLFLWTPAAGIAGGDWLWLGIAFALDLAHYGASAYGNRDKIPGYGSSV